tara:strand:- start:202 stop:681 length:480 start_codon:yes stop_codon:yes gene_type:complete
MTASVQVPSGTICGRKEGSNFLDIIVQAETFKGQEGIVFIDQLPELRDIDISQLYGVSISINRVRQGDRKVISNALPWPLQPDSLRTIAFGATESQPQQVLDFDKPQQEPGSSKRVSGRIRDPKTEQAFDQLMADRGINQTEAVEVAIRHGLIEMGYLA